MKEQPWVPAVCSRESTGLLGSWARNEGTLNPPVLPYQKQGKLAVTSAGSSPGVLLLHAQEWWE